MSRVYLFLDIAAVMALVWTTCKFLQFWLRSVAVEDTEWDPIAAYVSRVYARYALSYFGGARLCGSWLFAGRWR